MFKLNDRHKQTMLHFCRLAGMMCFFFLYTAAVAQQNTLATGGTSTTAGGSVAYSIGQLDYIVASGAGGTASQGVQQVYAFNLNLKAYIEAYYDGAGFMRPVLNNQGQVNGLNDVDSITVELHNPNPPYALAKTYTGVLQTNGSMVCRFPNVSHGETYYIVLKHRNALQTWSANPVTLTPVGFDFSTSLSNAYGSLEVAVEPGIYALYSGDLNADENIDLLDGATLDNDVANFAFGYLSSDINGDGNVDLLDVPVLEENINSFIFSIHP